MTTQTEITYNPPPVAWANPKAAVARWEYLEQWGYIYANGKCSCWHGKNDRACNHLPEDFALMLEQVKANRIVRKPREVVFLRKPEEQTIDAEYQEMLDYQQTMDDAAGRW